MDLQLKEKVAIVTGGASGIGRAITERLAIEGATVVMFGRRIEQAKPVLAWAAEKGLRCDFIEVELTDTSKCEAAVAEAVERHGSLDVLVNNAGVNDSVPLDGSVDDFRASLEKNLVQVFACTHFAEPHLRSTKGNIVNIGSKVADTGQGGTSGYAASKGGVNALTREWAISLAKDDVRCNCVIPAEVITPMYRSWLDSTFQDVAVAITEIGKLVPLGQRTTTEEEIASTVAFIASPLSSHTTGQIVYVDGGYTHLDRAYTS